MVSATNLAACIMLKNIMFRKQTAMALVSHNYHCYINFLTSRQCPVSLSTIYQNMQLFPEQLSFMKGHMHALASINLIDAIIVLPAFHISCTDTSGILYFSCKLHLDSCANISCDRIRMVWICWSFFHLQFFWIVKLAFIAFTTTKSFGCSVY